MTKQEELERLATPICRFLSENYDTGYKVIIDCDKFILVDEVIASEISNEK